MAGTGLAVGIVAGCAALVLGLTTVSAAAVTGQRLAGAADAAALAAADAASGASRGVPCERAADVAQAGGASLAACDVDGLVATVTVSATFGALTASASARAGPPPETGTR
ncbi:Rv3654c family TadE-like protein [Microbacterium sp. SS28]|uniref:Rv3654c family TadE-like protein n=1 Tax=Microbacterium sp. SS28 TaxID=2919948 RepID=UPI001FAAF6D9|nr:Rv3654c family TadE-like protein [Microbacterium sp. SS28]